MVVEGVASQLPPLRRLPQRFSGLLLLGFGIMVEVLSGPQESLLGEVRHALFAEVVRILTSRLDPFADLSPYLRGREAVMSPQFVDTSGQFGVPTRLTP